MSPPSTAGAAEPIRARPRWHTHGWNRPLSWRLIFAVAPRLPSPLLAVTRHIVTLLCFAFMTRERAAARRNLARVTGAHGHQCTRLAYRLFHNFSRFLVAYTSLRRHGNGWLRDRLEGGEEAYRTVAAALQGGRGAILLTMHLGHWDLGLTLLDRFQLPVHMVMQSEEPEGVARFSQDSRAIPGLRVHQTGSSPLLAVELMAALLRGEIVAVQGDRPAGPNVMETPFFGKPALLPTGPLRLALATGAPIVPVFVLLAPGNRYRVLALPPICPGRERSDGMERAVAEAMPVLARTMESVIERYPDQWFNFYDVWAHDDA